MIDLGLIPYSAVFHQVPLAGFSNVGRPRTSVFLFVILGMKLPNHKLKLPTRGRSKARNTRFQIRKRKFEEEIDQIW